MNRIATLLAASLLSPLVAGSALANNHLNLNSGGEPKPRVTQVQLGIVSPEAGGCPVDVLANVWVFSNKPMTATVFMPTSGGKVLGPFLVETKDNGNGVVMGQYQHTITFGSATSMDYRAVVPADEQMSNWVPVKVTC